ncbi:uncharacterized protein V6R79_019635 [Siganus canaliculatus]
MARRPAARDRGNGGKPRCHLASADARSHLQRANPEKLLSLKLQAVIEVDRLVNLLTDSCLFAHPSVWRE